MGKTMKQNGYVIQMYQFARRYRYNYEGCMRYFNYLADTPEHGRQTVDGEEQADGKHSDNAYMVLGDFDMLEINPVDTFRKYHDVSDLAKKNLGRRQNVLLYCIEDETEPPRLQYCCEKRCWCKRESDQPIPKRFFCLSLLSVTNEALNRTDIFAILPQLRKKILSMADDLNKDLNEQEQVLCEVYGALNATEVSIVWLCNQYVDVLMFLDYLKHMTLFVTEDKSETPLFLASNTTIATKPDEDFEVLQKNLVQSFPDVKGSAAVQISFQDELKDHIGAEKLIHEIVSGLDDEEYEVLYSAGEYDLVVRLPAFCALKRMQKNQILNNAERDLDGKYKVKLKEILRNNTQLLLEQDTYENCRLKESLEKQVFTLDVKNARWIASSTKTTTPSTEEWLELSDPEANIIRDNYQEKMPEKSNFAYYNDIRKRMEKLLRPSAGAIDMFDLLYADYLSTIANAYNKIWVSDFHCQFKAVLHAVDLWLNYQIAPELPNDNSSKSQWQFFQDLTNAFKQQVYHLAQSSRMVLEIPRCHFRMTSQYDLLIHTYYGFAKIILEAIYLMQGNDNQSDLIPLVTVNTVPQVKTELYFEYGNNDEMRAINLNIPASIIFDPQRGLYYLAHELFHYAVPQSREKRNYHMGCFIISESFKNQFIHIFNYILYTTVDGTIDKKIKKLLKSNTDPYGLSQLVRILFFVNHTGDEMEFGKYWLDEEILGFVQMNASRWRDDDKIGCGSKDTSVTYQRKIFAYCYSELSTKFFTELCEYLMQCIYRKFSVAFSEIRKYKTLEEIRQNVSLPSSEELDKLFDRFIYCSANRKYRTLQFSGLRSDGADNEANVKVIVTLWKAVREACSDTAMVSLTSMGLDDYLLFCIQSWQDTSCGSFKSENLDEGEWLRVGFVYNYLHKYWNLRDPDQIKNSFIKKYVHFYTSRKDLEEDLRFQKIVWDATDWWKAFVYKCHIKFAIGNAGKNDYDFISFFDSVFVPILSDFNVEEKASEFAVKGDKRLKSICIRIKKNVYDKYNQIMEDTLANNKNGGGWYIPWSISKEEDYRNKRFQCDLSVAQYFQKQKTLQQLSELNHEIRNSRINVHKWKPDILPGKNIENSREISWQFHVRSLEELLFYLQYCENKIQNGNENEPIWFRGQPNESFKLVPSIMRRYDQVKCKEHRSLRAYQQSEYEEFKYCADGAPEIPSGVRFTLSDYLALMQHYFVPTTLLDYSENAFFALYFALENYFENNTSDQKSVALYLLKPKKLNSLCREKSDARREDLTKRIADEAELWIEKNVITPNDWIHCAIPNLSTKPNEKKFDSYLLGNLEFDQEYAAWIEKGQDDIYEIRRKHITELCLPVAIWTSRLNTRIRKQSGCFVAFNLYMLPELGKQKMGLNNHAFDYASLEEIQREILRETSPEKKADNVFLYKIIIDGDCCQSVTKWLHGMGISRASVYPELELLKNRFK